MDDSGAIFLFLLGLLAFSVWFSARRRVANRRIAWRKAASDLGLTFEPLGSGLGDLIRGSIEGFAVSIYLPGGSATTRMRILVDGRGGFPNLVIDRNDWLGDLRRTAVLEEVIRTGDPDFDKKVLIRGDEPTAVAVLDDRTRNLLKQDAGDEPATLREGTIVWETSKLELNATVLASRVRGMVELASRLVLRREEIVEKLARNVTTDQVDTVRFRNLGLLVKQFGESAPAREACRASLESKDPALRLLAAGHLGKEALDCLRSIAETEEIDPEIRLEALDRFLGWTHPEQAKATLDRLLDSPALPIQRAAIEGIGRLGHKPALDQLLALADGADRATAITIAHALGDIGDPRAEPILLRWLEFGSDPERMAAARALARVGTVASVEPLLAHAKGVLVDGDSKQVCRDAVTNIQNRLGEAGPGRLSLSELDREDGKLSLAEEAGRLSVAEEDGRLSVPGGAEDRPRRAKANGSG